MRIDNERHKHAVSSRSQNELWRNTFLYNPQSLLIADLNGIVLLSNDSFKLTMGSLDASANSLNILALIYSSQGDLERSFIEDLIEERIHEFKVVRPLRIKENDRWFSINVSLVKDDFGNAAELLTVIEDITEKHDAELALRSSEERFRATVNYTHIGITMITLQGRFIDVNPSFATMLGHTQEECLGLTIFDVTHPDSIDETMQNVAKLIAGEFNFFRLVKKYWRKDRSWIWVQSTVSLIYDESAAPAKIVAVTEDITDRVRTEEGLRLSETRALFAAEAANIGTWDFDIASQLVLLCEVSRRILGVEAIGEVTLKEIIRCIYQDDRRNVLRALRATFQADGNGRFDMTFRVFALGGQLTWVQAMGQTFFPDHGNRLTPNRFSGAILNVTDQIIMHQELKSARAAAEEANAAKTIFLANMSHEIRTPLGAILGFSELLKSKRGSQIDNEHYLETIIRNGQSLIGIIDDILDISKVEAGQINIEEVDLDIYELLVEIKGLFLERCREKNIRVNLNIDPSIPIFINSDSTRVRQILVNLVGNALKFTEKGSIDIIARSFVFSNFATGISIAVKDSGIGLSPDHFVKVFQPFSQVDNSTTRRFGGTGLGLFLSHQLAKAMGGDITVRLNEAENESEVGCTFTFTFVAGQARNSIANKLLDFSPLSRSHHLQDKRILLAEDAFDNQLLISTILCDQGALVEIAQNGIIAVQKAFEQNFDIILMDLQMPQMDGYQATRKLRSSGYKKPIIALTAHAMGSERIKTREAGCDFHLTKPINPRELIDTIERCTLLH
ncbi:MAG: PAS domain S-box protein [Oligoflexus sp.]|nr:PAS domain S-box protein [Oligoflexus sp.]